MLTNYTWCIPTYTKEAGEVVHTFLDNIYSKFGGSHKILSDNETEFKNTIFAQVALDLLNTLKATDTLKMFITFLRHIHINISLMNLHGMK